MHIMVQLANEGIHSHVMLIIFQVPRDVNLLETGVLPIRRSSGSDRKRDNDF